MTLPYSDEECRYLGGDPRLKATGGAVVELLEDSIRIQIRDPRRQNDSVYIPKAAIQGVVATAERLGMEQAEYEENVAIGPDEWITRHIAVLDVSDPERAQPNGLRIRIAFRDEYFSKVFEKRCREAYKLPPF